MRKQRIACLCQYEGCKAKATQIVNQHWVAGRFLNPRRFFLCDLHSAAYTKSAIAKSSASKQQEAKLKARRKALPYSVQIGTKVIRLAHKIGSPELNR